MPEQPSFPAWAPNVTPPMPPEWIQEMYGYLLQHPLPWLVQKGGAYAGGQRPPIVGRVNMDGTVAAGVGFTVVRSATGIYAVTYSSAFAAEPHVSLSLLSTPLVSSSPIVPAFTARDRTGFTVHWQTASGIDEDVDWTFAASGVPA